jgi:hypothetical protein
MVIAARVFFIVVASLLVGASPFHRPACDLITKAELENWFGAVRGISKPSLVLYCAGKGGICSASGASDCNFVLAADTSGKSTTVQVLIAFAPFRPGDWTPREWANEERESWIDDATFRDVPNLGDSAFFWSASDNPRSDRWAFLATYVRKAHVYIYIHHIDDDAHALRAASGVARMVLSRI